MFFLIGYSVQNRELEVATRHKSTARKLQFTINLFTHPTHSKKVLSLEEFFFS